MINKIYNFFKKGMFIVIIYLILDIFFFSLLPDNIKEEFYNNRAHRVKSYYYHHDLRPNASFYDVWGYEKYKIHTNNLGFKDKNKREIKFKDRNILFIGDSFTEGVGLKFEDTFPWRRVPDDDPFKTVVRCLEAEKDAVKRQSDAIQASWEGSVLGGALLDAIDAETNRKNYQSWELIKDL